MLSGLRAGRFTRFFVLGFSLVATAFLGAVLLDLAVPFSDEWRALPLGLAITVSIIGLVWLAWSIFKIGQRQAAILADALSDDPRQSVLSWLELSLSDSAQKGPLAAYLHQQALQTAEARLKPISWWAAFRNGWPRRWWLAPFLTLAAWGLFFAMAPRAASTASTRLLFPTSDLPPYSLLHFVVNPDPAKVLYGEDLELEVTLKNDTPVLPVRLLTRSHGTVHESPCFESPGLRFSQKLDKVTEPLEFAFAAGNARSPWHKVELILQPRVMLGELTVQPPAYTGLPVQKFYPGRDEIALLPGSQVTLRLLSNRPLGSGTASLAPTDGTGLETRVEGKAVSERSLAFEWVARQNTDVSVRFSDIQGIASESPWVFACKIRPDQVPEVRITEPQTVVLATPDQVLPLVGYAEDDFGVQRADQVNAADAYAPRYLPIGGLEPAKRVTLESKVDLPSLGALPGQILTVQLEAMDTNPTLLGFAASEPVTIQVISKEEYAEAIRLNTGIEEFTKRYEVLFEKLSAAHEALKELNKALEENASQEEVAAHLNKALEANKAAADAYLAMANDFPAFDLDSKLSDAAREVAETLKQQGEKLAAARDSFSLELLVAAVQEAMKSMAGEAQRMDEQQAMAEEIAKISEVMSMAADFRALVIRQRELERRAGQAADASQDLAALLPSFQVDQNQLTLDTREFAKELREKAELLPEDQETLKSDSLKFAEALETSGADAHMERAVNHAAQIAPTPARREAGLARQKLEDLMNQSGNCFAGMCSGEMRFDVRQEMASTLAQMLKAMQMRAAGQGMSGAGGSGGGFSGSGSNGYWMTGPSGMNLPLYGPPRSSMGRAGGGRGNQGEGAGTGSEVVQANPSDASPNTDPAQEPAAKPVDLESIPEKYRNAVRTYFDLK